MINVPVVICPLEVERRAVAKALRGRARVIVSGPGKAAVKASVEMIAKDKDRPSLVVLFGVAGGLRDTEGTPRIGWVTDKDARTWTPACAPPGSGELVGMLGVDEPIVLPGKKRQMGEAYGAALVDMESHAFAPACEGARLRWAIVRGVSDGPDVVLPEGAMGWVDTKGKTRVGRVLAQSLLSPPTLIGAIGLWKRTGPALKAACGRLVELLEADRTAPHTIKVEVRAVAKPKVVSDLPNSAGSASGAKAGNLIEQQLGKRSMIIDKDPKKGR